MPNDNAARRSIELADILALRFQCKKCASALTVPLEEFSQWEERQRAQRNKLKPALTECPVCGELWAGYQPKVTNFVNDLQSLAAMVKEAHGLSLALEVKGESADS
jgi:hypothetical protein